MNNDENKYDKRSYEITNFIILYLNNLQWAKFIG